jgi:hypothetical protein
MGVGDVQELHGWTLKCRNGVGWNPARLTDRAVDAAEAATYVERVGKLVPILAACVGLLVAAAPAAAGATPSAPDRVWASPYETHELVDMDVTVDDYADWSHVVRVSNSPVVDPGGMLVHGVSFSSDEIRDWDVTDPATGGDSVEGPHDIYVQTQDLAGDWGALGGAEVILDRTGPVVTAAHASFSGGAAASPAVAADWDVSGTDANCSGPCPGSEVQVSSDGATWIPWDFPAGGTYQVRARETDYAGNTGDWTTVAPVSVSERQESNSAIRWTGPWVSRDAGTAYGGRYRTTTQGGATVTTTITASNLEVVGTRTLDGGLVRVYLDGALQGTVSEWGTGEVALLDANFAQVGAHTIKLVAVAPNGKKHRATFDAILTLRQSG